MLTPILGTPAPSIFQDAWLALRNASKRSKILSIKFKFIPVGLSRHETIKVDINLNEHQEVHQCSYSVLASFVHPMSVIPHQIASAFNNASRASR